MSEEIKIVSAIVSKMEAMKNGGEALTPSEKEILTALFSKGAELAEEMTNQPTLF